MNTAAIVAWVVIIAGCGELPAGQQRDVIGRSFWNGRCPLALGRALLGRRRATCLLPTMPPSVGCCITGVLKRDFIPRAGARATPKPTNKTLKRLLEACEQDLDILSACCGCFPKRTT